MAIKVTIPQGQTYARASDLYQWDYGQVLEIEAPYLPTVLEVHFACKDMGEAVIHSCSAVNNVASVVIPDQCLESANEITAWVYEIDGTSGRTLYRIAIPVIARTRPSRGESVPITVQDAYTQLITEVNEAVGKIARGEIVVANAAHATSADRALQADNASSAASAASATFATTASSASNASSASTALRADYATEADKALRDADNRKIEDTYIRCESAFSNANLFLEGVYQFKVTLFGTVCYAILPIVSGTTTQASLGFVDGVSYILRCSGDGKPKVMFDGTSSEMVESEAVISAKQIFNW